jgi:16S rRNA processing protein RimM
MEEQANSWTVLARLLRPQGRKGELLADLLTDFPESIAGRKDLYLVPEGFAGAVSAARPVNVLSSWLPVGKNRGRVVLLLDGVNSISEAEAFQGLDLSVPHDSRVPLEGDSNYVSDLEGCSVYDGEILVGEITGVQFPAASDGVRLNDVPSLLEVRSLDGDEILVPFVKAFIVSLDVADKKMVLRLPAGLIDVNR